MYTCITQIQCTLGHNFSMVEGGGGWAIAPYPPPLPPPLYDFAYCGFSDLWDIIMKLINKV